MLKVSLQSYSQFRHHSKDGFHKNVIQSIEALIAGFQSAEFSADYSGYKNPKNYFIPDVYRDSKNRKQPMYCLTRNGFQLLAMGFTGERTLQWKLLYIETFDKMESAIRKAITPTVQPNNHLDIARELLLAAESQAQRITVLEDKQTALENTVKQLPTVKPDWIETAKFRIEAITGKPFRSSGFFLSSIYSELEKSERIDLKKRITWLRKCLHTARESRKKIMAANTDKVLVEEQNIINGNFLIFSDITQPIGVADLVILIKQGIISPDGILIAAYKEAVQAAQPATTTANTTASD